MDRFFFISPPFALIAKSNLAIYIQRSILNMITVRLSQDPARKLGRVSYLGSSSCLFQCATDGSCFLAFGASALMKIRMLPDHNLLYGMAINSTVYKVALCSHDYLYVLPWTAADSVPAERLCVAPILGSQCLFNLTGELL